MAISTIEAEYIAFTEVIKEAMWLKGLIQGLGLSTTSIEVNFDSQSAINLSKN